MHTHNGQNSLPQLWKNAKGYLEQVFVFTPSDAIKAEALSEETTSQRFTPATLKQITVYRSGKIRATFDFMHGGSFGTVYLYVNGVSVKAFNAAEPSIVPFDWYSASEDVDVSTGQEVSLRAVSFDGESHSVRNFRLKWDTVRADDVQVWS